MAEQFPDRTPPNTSILVGGHALPPAIANLGAHGAKSFVNFFAARIANDNTRSAYLRATALFLAWLDSRQLALSDIEPAHVGAYLKHLEREGYAKSSRKQHLSAIKMLGDYLVVDQVISRNPAAGVKAPKHVVRKGKTPVLEDADVRALFEAINDGGPAAVRDRALMAVQLYTFGRVSAVLGTDRDDYYQEGRAMMLRLKEKGGVDHKMPLHHRAIDSLDAYLAWLPDDQGPLFRTVNRKRDGFTTNRMHRSEALRMWKRRCRRAGLGDRYGNHTPRATGITNYLTNGGKLEHAQHMAAHASPKTTRLYDRRDEQVTLDEVQRINFS